VTAEELELTSELLQKQEKLAGGWYRGAEAKAVWLRIAELKKLLGLPETKPIDEEPS
jgi:hypothetical protein